jgi:FtsZ-binding cell division protein ZapB
MPKCPHVVVKAVEADVVQHMSAQGLGSPLIESPTVAGTLAAITMCQGALIEGDGAAAFGAASGAIVTMVGECKGKSEGEGQDMLVARGDEYDSLMLIQSLQIEVAAVKDVNHQLEGVNQQLEDANQQLEDVNQQLSNTIEEVQDANEGLKGDNQALKGDNARLHGALSSSEEKAGALELRVEASQHFDPLEVECELVALSDWLQGLGVEMAKATACARVLRESGVADVSVLREVDAALAEEVLLAAGLTEAEANAAMESWIDGTL